MKQEYTAECNEGWKLLCVEWVGAGIMGYWRKGFTCIFMGSSSFRLPEEND